ncbi:MAG: AraC family transcriptional regulator [Bacteroidota bacterium]
MNANLLKHENSRKLNTLIENRTIYSADYAELNVFETHMVAENVDLQFGFPVIASMLSGKKIMHLKNKEAFEFFPGESVVLQANEKMTIDFPLAAANSPTRCLALGISPDKIRETVELFNQNTRIEFENDIHDFEESSVHLNNNEQVQFILDRIFTTFLGSNKAKDALVDLMVKELIIRLLQTRAKSMLVDNSILFENNRMAFIVKYLREHLTENISVNKLADKACMSTSNFHRIFKNTIGESPIDFLNGERIKFAKNLILNTSCRFTDIAAKAGFNNTSYFNRQFKRFEKITPNQFRNMARVKSEE